MAASEQPGSGRSFKQHYSSGAGICMPFGQSTWHCCVHVNMFSHAVRLSPQYQCCYTQLFMVYAVDFSFNELTVEMIAHTNVFKQTEKTKQANVKRIAVMRTISSVELSAPRFVDCYASARVEADVDISLLRHIGSSSVLLKVRSFLQWLGWTDP